MNIDSDKISSVLKHKITILKNQLNSNINTDPETIIDQIIVLNNKLVQYNVDLVFICIEDNDDEEIIFMIKHTIIQDKKEYIFSTFYEKEDNFLNMKNNIINTYKNISVCSCSNPFVKGELSQCHNCSIKPISQDIPEGLIDDCSICLTKITNINDIYSGVHCEKPHYIHESCLKKMVKKECPICKSNYYHFVSS